MTGKLIREYKCDHQYCLKKARVETGSMECGTNYGLEEDRLVKRGWAIIGFNHYCKQHKVLHNWGTYMTKIILGG